MRRANANACPLHMKCKTGPRDRYLCGPQTRGKTHQRRGESAPRLDDLSRPASRLASELAVTLLVLLAGAARARLVAADLRLRDDRALPLAGTTAADGSIEPFDHAPGRRDERSRAVRGQGGCRD